MQKISHPGADSLPHMRGYNGLETLEVFCKQAY